MGRTHVHILDRGEDVRVAAREDLTAALRLASCLGMGGGIDHYFSLKLVSSHGQNAGLLLNPSLPCWADIEAGDLLLTDYQGAILEGEGESLISATTLHRSIHAARADISCIMHAYMPHAIVFCLLQKPAFSTHASQTAILFHDDIAWYNDYRGFICTQEEANQIVVTLSDKHVLFLAHRGVVVLGASIAEAFARLYYLEIAAREQILALSTSLSQRLIAQDRVDQAKQVIMDTFEGHARQLFATLRAQLAKGNSLHRHTSFPLKDSERALPSP